jgi:hypothetical protein
MSPAPSLPIRYLCLFQPFQSPESTNPHL